MGVYQSCLGFLASTQPCILREVAMRHNPVIKAFYERLVGRGKSKKTGSYCLCAENLSYS